MGYQARFCNPTFIYWATDTWPDLILVVLAANWQLYLCLQITEDFQYNS